MKKKCLFDIAGGHDPTVSQWACSEICFSENFLQMRTFAAPRSHHRSDVAHLDLIWQYIYGIVNHLLVDVAPEVTLLDCLGI